MRRLVSHRQHVTDRAVIEAAGVAADAVRLVAFRDVTRVLAKGTGEAVPEAAALMERHDMAVAVTATVPMELLPNVVPNRFISGFTLGAVKG